MVVRESAAKGSLEDTSNRSLGLWRFAAFPVLVCRFYTHIFDLAWPPAVIECTGGFDVAVGKMHESMSPAPHLEFRLMFRWHEHTKPVADEVYLEVCGYRHERVLQCRSTY